LNGSVASLACIFIDPNTTSHAWALPGRQQSLIFAVSIARVAPRSASRSILVALSRTPFARPCMCLRWVMNAKTSS